MSCPPTVSIERWSRLTNCVSVPEQSNRFTLRSAAITHAVPSPATRVRSAVPATASVSLLLNPATPRVSYRWWQSRFGGWSDSCGQRKHTPPTELSSQLPFEGDPSTPSQTRARQTLDHQNQNWTRGPVTGSIFWGDNDSRGSNAASAATSGLVSRYRNPGQHGRAWPPRSVGQFGG